MTKVIYLMAGITFALGLNAHQPNKTKSAAISDKADWTVFVDHKNQIWSLPESEWQEYVEALRSEDLFALCQASMERFKQAEGNTFCEGPEPRLFYSRRRLQLGASRETISKNKSWLPDKKNPPHVADKRRILVFS